jgi:hypothetical protein
VKHGWSSRPGLGAKTVGKTELAIIHGGSGQNQNPREIFHAATESCVRRWQGQMGNKIWCKNLTKNEEARGLQAEAPENPMKIESWAKPSAQNRNHE